MFENISDRIRAAIEAEMPDRKRAATLEEVSGISAETWRKFISGKQNATAAILEAVCQQWPKYAFWISTGITDSNYGHVAPKPAYDNVINRQLSERPGAELYFRFKMALLKEREPESELSIDEVMPKPHEGHHSTRREMDRWNSDEERDAYFQAGPREQLRIEIGHFRDSWERMNADYEKQRPKLRT